MEKTTWFKTQHTQALIAKLRGDELQAEDFLYRAALKSTDASVRGHAERLKAVRATMNEIEKQEDEHD